MSAAPAITEGNFIDIDWSLKTFMPTFDLKYFTSISILVFAVGGCEKISPYVNKMDNPSKGFPKGMIALAIMVAKFTKQKMVKLSPKTCSILKITSILKISPVR